MLGILTVVTILVCVQALPASVEEHKGQKPSLYFDTVARIAKDGFYSETHSVTTSDGYILEINRIPFGRDEKRDDAAIISKPVIFLMHGLQGSALSYITLGPGQSLGYILADEGYDVWIGNARGALNSRRHVILNPDDEDDAKLFFDYSFEDIGLVDLPTMLDYVLDFTKQSKLHYIGHSQGGTTFLVMNSMLPEYQDKVISAHLLAGVGYQNHFPSRLLSFLAANTNSIYSLAQRNGLIELIGPELNEIFLGQCSPDNQELCDLLIVLELMNDLVASLEMIAGASVKQYAHYGQNINDKKFRKWSYGPIGNLLRYRSLSPPEFDISSIKIDCTMHYTVSDILLSENDVLDMAEVMPNTKVRRVARDSYSHTDFVVARDSKELVYDYIVEALKEHK